MKTGAEAIRALATQLPAFRQKLSDGWYQVRIAYDQPTSDITKDKCSKCLSGCKFRNNVGNFGGFLSINKLSQ
ncbi:phage minor tail protein [Escherichia coli]|nr:phage minor tail protein [Escherichia coli]